MIFPFCFKDNLKTMEVFVPNDVKIGYVTKSKIDPRLFSMYNLILRRLPHEITEENIYDTFYDFSVKHVKLYKISQDEKIACLKMSNNCASVLFEVLNGKVIKLNDHWYPIEMIYVKDYIEPIESLAVSLNYRPILQEQNNEEKEEEENNEEGEQNEEEEIENINLIKMNNNEDKDTGLFIMFMNMFLIIVLFYIFVYF